MDRNGPGTLLAGRYRLQEQVSSDPVTTLWRAEDLTLERPVAVRVLSATHARVQSTLDAARRAALVDDVRLQRVYGVGVEAGIGYVVLEWITGQDAVALAGKVSEAEALRIVVEAGEALRTAASRQLHHGRLGPRQVVRASDGRVRVVGTAIDVAATGQATPAAAAHPESRDVRDLSAVLYALLSGLWPFGVTEGLLAAPTEKGRPVGPRTVRGDVSGRLDALLGGVLAGTGPDSLDRLLQALRAVRDGEPPVAPPVAQPEPARTAAAAVTGAALATGTAGDAVRPVVAPGDTDVLTPLRGGDAGDAGRPAAPAGVPGATASGAGAVAGAVAGAGSVGPVGAAGAGVAAGAAAGGLAAAAGGLAAGRTPEVGPTHPYPVQDPADGVGVRSGDTPGSLPRTAPARAAAAPAAYVSRTPAWQQEEDDGWDLLPVGDQAWDDQGWEAARPVEDGRQPWDDDPWDGGYGDPVADDRSSAGSVLPAATARRGTRRSPSGAGTGVAVVLVMGAFVVGTLVWALDRVQDDQDVAAPVPTVTQTVQPSVEPSVVPPPPAPVPSDAPVLVSPAGVQALDPQGDGEENDQDAPRAIDGDPASAWQTQRYNTQDFGRLKTGLGLAFDLGAPAEVQSVTITAPGDGGTYEVRAATGPGYDGSTVVATGQTGAAPVVLAPETPVTTQFLVVWFTALPQLDGEFRAAVSEVQVQVP